MLWERRHKCIIVRQERESLEIRHLLDDRLQENGPSSLVPCLVDEVHVQLEALNLGSCDITKESWDIPCGVAEPTIEGCRCKQVLDPFLSEFGAHVKVCFERLPHTAIEIGEPQTHSTVLGTRSGQIDLVIESEDPAEDLSLDFCRQLAQESFLVREPLCFFV